MTAISWVDNTLLQVQPALGTTDVEGHPANKEWQQLLLYNIKCQVLNKWV
jgi:hypothetical protein